MLVPAVPTGRVVPPGAVRGKCWRRPYHGTGAPFSAVRSKCWCRWASVLWTVHGCPRELLTPPSSRGTTRLMAPTGTNNCREHSAAGPTPLRDPRHIATHATSRPTPLRDPRHFAIRAGPTTSANTAVRRVVTLGCGSSFRPRCRTRNDAREMLHPKPTAPADTPIDRSRAALPPRPPLVDSANSLLSCRQAAHHRPRFLPRPGDPTLEGLTARSNSLDSRSPRKRRAGALDHPAGKRYTTRLATTGETAD
jgi:hypothetical protein